MKFHLLSIPLLVLASLAGCLTETEAPAAIPEPITPAAPPADVPVSFDGGLLGGVTVCPVLTCAAVTPLGEGPRIHQADGVEGLLSRVNLTLTWDASSPLTEELYFGVFTCAEDCTSDQEITNWEYVVGASPLVLDLTDLEVPEGEVLFVYVSPPGLTPAVYTSVTTPQPFHVEGTLTPAAEEAEAPAAQPTAQA